MGSKKYYKKYIQDHIDLDPTNFIQNIKVNTPDGYGGNTSELVHRTIVGRLYKTSSGLAFASEQGLIVKNRTTVKVLFKAEVEILEGEILTTGSDQYRVTLVKNLLDVCKQLELEVIV